MNIPSGSYYGLPVYRYLNLTDTIFGDYQSRSYCFFLAQTGPETFVAAYIEQEPPAARITARDIADLSASVSRDLYTAVRVAYAYDFARGETTKALVLEAEEPLIAFGRIESELRCEWLQTSRAALRVGTAWLRRASRPRWEITLTVGIDYAGLNPGDWLELEHPRLPVDAGRFICLDVAPDFTRAETRITVEAVTGDIPTITLATMAAAYDPQTLPGVAVQFAAGTVKLTFRDEFGRPLAGATAILDHAAAVTTDAAGAATFQGVSRGDHVVTVRAPGYPVIEQQVTV